MVDEIEKTLGLPSTKHLAHKEYEDDDSEVKKSSF